MEVDINAYNCRLLGCGWKRLDGVMLAARKATEIDADDANAWWPLPLVL